MCFLIWAGKYHPLSMQDVLSIGGTGQVPSLWLGLFTPFALPSRHWPTVASRARRSVKTRRVWELVSCSANVRPGIDELSRPAVCREWPTAGFFSFPLASGCRACWLQDLCKHPELAVCQSATPRRLPTQQPRLWCKNHYHPISLDFWVVLSTIRTLDTPHPGQAPSSHQPAGQTSRVQCTLLTVQFAQLYRQGVYMPSHYVAVYWRLADPRGRDRGWRGGGALRQACACT